MPSIYCDVCDEEIVLDDDGEAVGGCPVNNPSCDHAVCVPGDEYAPLNFHADEMNE